VRVTVGMGVGMWMPVWDAGGRQFAGGMIMVMRVSVIMIVGVGVFMCGRGGRGGVRLHQRRRHFFG
jgi:ABC-type nickel/cobalt efflux system permease component RcnA